MELSILCGTSIIMQIKDESSDKLFTYSSTADANFSLLNMPEENFTNNDVFI